MEEKKKDVEFEMFAEAHALYRGMKRYVTTEFKNLKVHKDWKEVLPELKKAIEAQNAERDKKVAAGEFAPEYKHFSKWLDGRWWEMVPVVPNVHHNVDTPKTPYF